MEEKQQGLSDAVLIEIVHGIKEIILELITRAYTRKYACDRYTISY